MSSSRCLMERQPGDCGVRAAADAEDRRPAQRIACSPRRYKRHERQRGETPMKVTAAVLVTALSLASGWAHAGPCTDEIARFEQEARQAARNPDAGPTAMQTLGAQLHRQPTPEFDRSGEGSGACGVRGPLEARPAARWRGRSHRLHGGARCGQTHVHSVAMMPEAGRFIWTIRGSLTVTMARLR